MVVAERVPEEISRLIDEEETGKKENLVGKMLLNNPEKSSESEKETSFKENIKETVEAFPLERLDLMSSGVGGAVVYEMVREFRNDNLDEMREIANYAKSTWESVLKKNNQENANVLAENFKIAVLGEVATAITLQEMGFDVYTASNKADTEGKVDLWAIDETGGEAYAIQVKTKTNLEKPVILDLEDVNEVIKSIGNENVSVEEKHKEFKGYLDRKELTSNQFLVEYKDADNKIEDVNKTRKYMLQYVSSARNRHDILKKCSTIGKFEVFLPAGERNDEPAFTVVNGVPTEKLYKALDGAIVDYCEKMGLY